MDASPAATATPLLTMALDGDVDLARADRELPWRELRRTPYGATFSRPSGRRAWLFRFGALVLEEGGEPDPDAVALVERATGRRAWLDTIDRLTVREDPTLPGSAPRATWTEVVLPAIADESLAAVALLMGQSAALERYERGANALIEEALVIARELARAGRPPRGDRALVRRVGAILVRQLELGQLFFLVDRPEEAWERPDVGALYDVLFNELDLRDRHQAVLHKLGTVRSTAESTFSILHSRRSNQLEIWIVILIVVEIVLFLVGLG